MFNTFVNNNQDHFLECTQGQGTTRRFWGLAQPFMKSQNGACGEAGGVEVEQLCSLCNRDGRDCPDRIAMDRAETRTKRCRARGQSPTSRKKREKMATLLKRLSAQPQSPVPSKGSICGVPAALSVTVMLPCLIPTEVGLKVTFT